MCVTNNTIQNQHQRYTTRQPPPPPPYHCRRYHHTTTTTTTIPVGVVKSEQEPKQGRLATARGTHHRHLACVGVGVGQNNIMAQSLPNRVWHWCVWACACACACVCMCVRGACAPVSPIGPRAWLRRSSRKSTPRSNCACHFFFCCTRMPSPRLCCFHQGMKSLASFFGGGAKKAKPKPKKK